MGFSFQSLGQLGLLQSLLGAGPAVSGQGTGLPGSTPGDGPFGALLQQALSTVDSASFSGSGAFSSTSAASGGAQDPFSGAQNPFNSTKDPFDGVLDSFNGAPDIARQPALIFLKGLPADQDLVAAPYGLDEAYNPQAASTDVLNAAIAETPSAFNAKIAAALRTQTIKPQPSSAVPQVAAQPVPVQPAPPVAGEDALPEVLPEALGETGEVSPVAIDAEKDEVPEDIGAETQTVAAIVIAPTLVPIPVPVAATPPVPADAEPIEVDTIAAAVRGSAQTSPPLAPPGKQIVEQALANGEAGKAQPDQGKGETAEAKLEPEVKTDPLPKERRQSAFSEPGAGSDRKGGTFTPQEQPGNPVKHEAGPPHPVNYRPPEVGPVSGVVAPQPVAQTAPAQPIERPAPERTRPTPATDQVGVAVARAAKDGRTEIHVRLDPAELGRVEVRLHFQADGEVRAQVTTDNPQTFDLLRRDAQVLERALQDAGLRTDSGSLSFSLRQQDHQAGHQEFSRNNRSGSGSGTPDRTDSPTVAALEASSRGRKPTSLFDVLA